MATEFTQDTVLHFLQSSGGSVKNADLLLHFRNFIRDHADRDRNRELFKKFINSVATVQQIDGVSFVVLRKKYKGHVAGGGDRGSSGPLRVPAGRSTEPPSTVQPRPKPQLTEVTTPAEKTVLPAAGIILNNNNNNVEANLNLKPKQQQVISTPAPAQVSRRPAAPQVVSQISEKTEVKTPSLPEPPAQDQRTKLGQNRVDLVPSPGLTPVVAAVRHRGETCQQFPVPEPVIVRHACLQPKQGLHQEPPLHLQVSPRRFRNRQSYKSAVSCDEDEEEEEDFSVKRGSAGGMWPRGAPFDDTGRVVSPSSPCITVPSVSPSVSSCSSSERTLPRIYIQNVQGQLLPAGGPDRSLDTGVGHRGQWTRRGPESGSVPKDSAFSRHSIPLETERYIASPDRAEEVVLHRDVHAERKHVQPAGVHFEPTHGTDQRLPLSSSHSSIFSPSSDAGHSSPRGSGWNSSYEELQTRTGNAVDESKIQVLQPAQRTRFEPGSKTAPPWHRSAEHLHDDQEPTARVSPLYRSTGDLYDDREESESSEGSPLSSPLRPRAAVARRLSSQLRSRKCRSLGADLDQVLQHEAKGAVGSEAARLNRLHLISSSLSLRYNLSSSSLSSCSTPPLSRSLADLVEREGKEGKSLPAASSPAAHHEGSSRQSLVPLEPREHAWLVKGAAGAWPDIYTLFREDSSLLNRRDFISGFTVLHWIAKHGDHRVLNTLWYGVQKAGLAFDINARAACGHTPLHIAAIHGHKNIIRLLVNKFHADVRLRDTAGKKAWQYLSCTIPSDVFQLLGAPLQATLRGEGMVGRVDSSWQPEKSRSRRHRLRHHLSSASSGERPLTISGTAKVKRSSSLAAFLKHKSLQRFQGHQSDSSI
uniref:uncharacterized protein LOC124051930 n=1 Tax=Scatophagus argus TaxID=75038 RepID=UPI001ED80B4C|nr:uncharacterized protein LOC124051930 [Scatophagus argus]